MAAGVTLVGPHRDDFSFQCLTCGTTAHNVKFYGSRGQQRLAILQLKNVRAAVHSENFGRKTTFILDDIFSELDEGHIHVNFGRNRQAANNYDYDP